MLKGPANYLRAERLKEKDRACSSVYVSHSAMSNSQNAKAGYKSAKKGAGLGASVKHGVDGSKCFLML